MQNILEGGSGRPKRSRALDLDRRRNLDCANPETLLRIDVNQPMDSAVKAYKKVFV